MINIGSREKIVIIGNSGWCLGWRLLGALGDGQGWDLSVCWIMEEDRKYQYQIC